MSIPPSDAEIAELQLVAKRAVAFLEPFVLARRVDWPRFCAQIRPEEADWARVFVAPYDEQARREYADLFEPPSIPGSHSDQTEVRIRAIGYARLFQTPDALFASLFPRGFQEVGPALQPDAIWVSWNFEEPGNPRNAMCHNGLVRVSPDRWAWFPKPWRVLTL